MSESVDASIPPPGFYWARIEGANRWEPVEVYEAGHRRVDSIGIESNCNVIEWGPRLEPPDSGSAERSG